jgi:hypothetical protein
MLASSNGIVSSVRQVKEIISTVGKENKTIELVFLTIANFELKVLQKRGLTRL